MGERVGGCGKMGVVGYEEPESGTRRLALVTTLWTVRGRRGPASTSNPLDRPALAVDQIFRPDQDHVSSLH